MREHEQPKLASTMGTTTTRTEIHDLPVETKPTGRGGVRHSGDLHCNGNIRSLDRTLWTGRKSVDRASTAAQLEPSFWH